MGEEKYDDQRGSYQELGKIDETAKVLGREVSIKQLSLSRNKPRGVLRGIHAEEMDKLVTPLNGRVFIAIVDIRSNSPTFGKYITFSLDMRDENKSKKTIVVSRGLGNAFLTIGEESDPAFEYLYQTEKSFRTSVGKRALQWNDTDVGIPWPIQPTIISDDDKYNNPTLRVLFPEGFK